MNIAIASDDGTNIASHFGWTRGFIIFNVQDEKIVNQSYRKDTFTGHARGLSDKGQKIDRHSPVVEAFGDCNVVISKGMGRRIYDDLKQARIEVFITEKINAKEAAELFLQNQLVDKPELSCGH